MKVSVLLIGLLAMMTIGTVAWGRQPLESTLTRPPISSSGHVMQTPSVNRVPSVHGGPVYRYHSPPVSPIAPRSYIVVPRSHVAPRYYYYYQPGGSRLHIRTYRYPGGSRLGYYHGGRWYSHYEVPGQRYGYTQPLPHQYRSFGEHRYYGYGW